jgi:uncharacterized protein YkwD
MPTTYARRPLTMTAVGLATILISALFVITTPWHPATAHALTAAPSGKDPNNFAWHVLRIVNKKRAHHGVAKVEMRSCTRSYATSWGDHLAKTNSWYHSNLYSILSDCNLNAAAENLVMYPDGYTARQVVKLWMHSSGHRKNLLNPTYRVTGVYFIWDNDQQMWYGVQEFGRH